MENGENGFIQNEELIAKAVDANPKMKPGANSVEEQGIRTEVNTGDQEVNTGETTRSLSGEGLATPMDDQVQRLEESGLPATKQQENTETANAEDCETHLDEIKVETESWDLDGSEEEEEDDPTDVDFVESSSLARRTVTHRNELKSWHKRVTKEVPLRGPSSEARLQFNPELGSRTLQVQPSPTGQQVLERYLFLRKVKKETPQKTNKIIIKELKSFWSEQPMRESASERAARKILDTLVGLYKAHLRPRTANLGKVEEQARRFTKVLEDKIDISAHLVKVKKETGEETLDGPRTRETGRSRRSGTVRDVHNNIRNTTVRDVHNNYSWLCQPKLEDEKDNNSTNESLKLKRTMDYFNDDLGAPVDRRHPTPAEFASALLREILFFLHQGHPLIEKVRLGSLLLHLVGKTRDFTHLYRYYEEVELEAEEGRIEWSDQAFFRSFSQKIRDSVSKGNSGFDQTILDKRASVGGEGEPLEYPGEAEVGPEDTGQDEAASEVENNSGGSQDEDSEFEPNKKDGPKSARLLRAETPAKGKRGRKRKRDNPNFDSEEERRNRNRKKYEYPCHQCDIIFKSVRKLEVHLFEEHSFGSLCSQCGYQSLTYSQYEMHMDSHNIQCDVCQVPVLGLKGLRNHNNRYHKPETEPEIEKEDTMCYICGKKVRKSYLQLHVRNVHEVETVQCDKCEFSTNTRDKLRVHMRRTHLNTLKTCPVCKKQVRMLKRHWEVTKCGGKVTTGVFTCDICSKQMSTELGLRKHKKVIHLKAKDKQCSLCSYATYSKFNLRLHVTKVHTKENMETNCTICNVKTYSIDWHMKTYHDDVPWQPGYNIA